MTAFRSEGEVRAWLRASARGLGALVMPQTLHDLGREWYATRMDIDWQPAMAGEATAVFAAHGLVGEFWSLV